MGVLQRERIKAFLRREEVRMSDVQIAKKPSKPSSTGWVALIRTVMWIMVVLGILASFALAALVYNIIEDETPTIIVGALGILLTLILSAAIMIFLDMADDIHAIRQMMQKK